MTKSVLLVIVACVIAAQCAVLRDEGAVHKRVARSPGCHKCEHDGPRRFPPPPLPPPFFRTENWSGLARSADGSQRGVFSGAAAAVGGSPQASGEAFSLASSSVDSSYKEDGQQLSDLGGDRSDGQQQSSKGHKYAGPQSQSNFNSNDQQQAYFGGGPASKAESNSFRRNGQGQGDRHGGSFTNSGRGDQGEQQQESSSTGGDYSDSQSVLNSGISGLSTRPKPGYNGQNELRDEAKQQQQRYGSGAFPGPQSSSHSGSVSGHESSGSYGQGSSHGSGYRSNGGNSQYQHEGSNAYRGGYKEDGQQLSDFSGDKSDGQQQSSKSHKYAGLQSQTSKSGQGQEHRYGGSFTNSGRGDLGEQQQESSGGSGDYSDTQSAINSGFSGHNTRPKHGYIGQNGRGDEGKQQQQPQGYGSGGFSGPQSSSYSGSVSGHESSGSYGQGSSHGSSYGSNGGNSQYQHEQSNANQQQLQSSGSGIGEWEQFNDGTKGSSSSHKEAHTALKGALDLTSEGLKTTEHTGCSSCGKSSYAVSNAKSHSGSAIAVSIGG